MMEDSEEVPDKKIHELTEIYDERNGYGRRAADGKNPQQIVMIDGRGYERVRPNGNNIQDLTDVVEDNALSSQLKEEIMKRAAEIIEKIARDVIPDIAERVIREEIEKIKTMDKDPSTDRD